MRARFVHVALADAAHRWLCAVQRDEPTSADDEFTIFIALRTLVGDPYWLSRYSVVELERPDNRI